MSQSAISYFVYQFYLSIQELIASLIKCDETFLFLPSRYPEIYNASELAILTNDPNHELYVSHDDPIVGFVATQNEIFNINGLNESLPPLPNKTERMHVLAIPIILFNLPTLDGSDQAARLSGVLVLTRKPTNPIFSREDEDLTIHFSNIISTVIGQIIKTVPENRATTNYQDFQKSCKELEKKLGEGEISYLRLKSNNFNNLERQYTPQIASNLYEQAKRIIQQTIPPHFPINQLPNGDILIAVDSLMKDPLRHKLKVSFVDQKETNQIHFDALIEESDC